MALPKDETAFEGIEDRLADVYAAYNSTFPEDVNGDHAPLDWVSVVRALNEALLIARSMLTSSVTQSLRGAS